MSKGYATESVSHRDSLSRIIWICSGLVLGLGLVMILGLAWGSTGEHLMAVFKAVLSGNLRESVHWTIIWQIRLPRVLLAAAVGATLGVGGLVFQAMLRNPLAEPYILGVSGGSAVGAVLGMMLGLRFFPGVAGLAFSGSLITLLLVLLLTSKRRLIQENSLLLAGVMVNAFCSAIITFLISITEHTKLQDRTQWIGKKHSAQSHIRHSPPGGRRGGGIGPGYPLAIQAGNGQESGLARALCQEPEIMLLDEPTSALDLAHQVRIMDLLEELLAEHELTVIMAAHDLNLASLETKSTVWLD